METQEKKQPYFSIVMPTYGVGPYIAKAISSIQSQTYANWEILIIDDCSPDKSAQIAEEAAKTDERIRLIHHEENKGLSAARNTGISEACGEYIWFMDPDDYVDAEVLEHVKSSLEKNPAEVVLFGLIEEYYDAKGKLEYTHSVCPKEKLCANRDELREQVIYLERQTLYGYAWNKIYNLEYLRNLRLCYENVKLIEDILFNVKYFMDIQTLNILAITPYHYAKRQNTSLTNQFVPEYFKLHRKRIELLFDQHVYWNLCTGEVREILGSLYGRYLLSGLERNCDKRGGMDHAKRYRWCRARFCEGLFHELIPSAKAEGSKTLALALWLLRKKNVMLCLMMGRTVHVVKKCLPMVYSKTKSGR